MSEGITDTCGRVHPRTEADFFLNFKAYFNPEVLFLSVFFFSFFKSQVYHIYIFVMLDVSPCSYCC